VNDELVTRPSVLTAIDTPKPWGWELWLTSTRTEGAAHFPRAEGTRTLAALVANRPEVLGKWARRIFGDEMPIFAKLIHTDFPSRVHIGFRRGVERGELLGWLDQEQALMRHLFAALRTETAAAFAAYAERYSTWATAQALAGWRRDDDGTSASALAPFVAPSFELAPWLRAVRANRAAIVDTLNDVDLRDERGNLLLSSAGIVHAIFGLSHQTHPLDRSRPALEELFATLASRAEAGATDEELTQAIDAAGLAALRAQNDAPPKNEAWFPTVVAGAEVLAEPQQTSDTTYSLADFYTPLTWGGDRARFRKGAPAHGVSREELSRYLAQVDLGATPVDSIRCAPKRIGTTREGAELSCLVDAPIRWPFFTAYQIELAPSPSAPSARATCFPPRGVFQQLVVTRGKVDLGDGAGTVGELSPRAPGFVPATLASSYTLAAREPSTVLIYSVPGARRGGGSVNADGDGAVRWTR
jgi:hypothetical protein